jgi:hypothetical protein
MADSVRAEGGCLCGAVRYRVEGVPSYATLCHCRTCRRAAAAPAVAWITFPANGLSFVAGRPVAYRSSPNVERTFCGRCGTPLTYVHDDFPAAVDVTTCSLDDPDAFPPADHTWTSHGLGWTSAVDRLPAHPRARP